MGVPALTGSCCMLGCWGAGPGPRVLPPQVSAALAVGCQAVELEQTMRRCLACVCAHSRLTLEQLMGGLWRAASSCGCHGHPTHPGG